MKLHWVLPSLFCLLAVWPTEDLESGQALGGTAGPALHKTRFEPEILSLFPLGGSRGTRSRVEVRGQGLEGANSFWPTAALYRGK
jgi:hypothetical protein